MPLDLRYDFNDISNEERLLHEMLAELHSAYLKVAQPYIDRLAMIRSLRTPTIIINLPPEQLG